MIVKVHFSLLLASSFRGITLKHAYQVFICTSHLLVRSSLQPLLCLLWRYYLPLYSRPLECKRQTFTFIFSVFFLMFHSRLLHELYISTISITASNVPPPTPDSSFPVFMNVIHVIFVVNDSFGISVVWRFHLLFSGSEILRWMTASAVLLRSSTEALNQWKSASPGLFVQGRLSLRS